MRSARREVELVAASGGEARGARELARCAAKALRCFGARRSVDVAWRQCRVVKVARLTAAAGCATTVEGHLRTPSEGKRARSYLLANGKQHHGPVAADPFAPRAPVAAARTWLLRRAPL